METVGFSSQFEASAHKLKELEFVQIATSNLFAKNDVVAAVNREGGYRFFVNYDNGVDPKRIKGIKRGKGFENSFSLITYSVEGGKDSFTERTTNGSGGGIWGEKPSPADFDGKSLDQQLLESGFIPDEENRGIYRQTIKGENRPTEVIAIMEDGIIQRILKPLNDRVEEKINDNTKIIGYKAHNAEYSNRLVSEITLDNGTIQFTVSTEYGGNIVDGSQRLLRGILPEELGLKKFEVMVEPGGFKIGGTNASELIRKLDKINGQSIAQLEEKMRPHRDSAAGFLGKEESLLEVMAQDNDYVLSRGLTHQDLAAPLQYAERFWRRGNGDTFEYKGQRFKVKAVAYRGMQFSPFNDKTGTNVDMTITNLTTGIKLSCSALLGDMIERYGFYEGKDTSYRLEPAAIIDVFDFLAGKSN